MFCYCRLLRRALLTNNWSGTQFFFTSSIHNEFLSPQTNEIPCEKKPSLSAVKQIRTLEFLWRKKKGENFFKKAIQEYILMSEASPSHSADLLRVACDKSHFQSDLVYSLLINLKNTINDNGLKFSPSLENKLEAFRSVLPYKNYQILQEVCNVFKMHEQSHCFKEIIDNLIEQQKFVEAAYSIGVLNLQHEYAVENLLFPLLVEGDLHPVISCIKNHPDLQLSIVKKLDSLLITGDICSRTSTPTIKSRKVFKMLNKIVNMFKISIEHCKNLYYVRSRAAINLLIRRRSEQSVSEDSWESMVMAVVGENAQLKDHLIYKLMKQNDKETALKMIERLNMIDFDVTKLDLHEETEANFENMVDKDELEDIPEEQCSIKDIPGHLMFPLSSSDINFIYNTEAFIEFIKDITKYDIIGIDTEWKPHFGLSAERLALIQIAARDKVYILDMVSLNEYLTTNHWDELMEKVFGNPKIIKLGCGIMVDVQMIVDSNQGTKGKKIRFTHILDMAIFYEKLQDIYPDEFKKDPGNENRKSLSKLCEIILGLPLNKEERLCDWEKRPLSDSQLQYAALDAYCLIQMYDKLKHDAAKKNFNFNHLANVSMFVTTNQWKPKKRFRGVKHEKYLQIEKLIPIQQFKVVVDSALETQGKQLRFLGADVLILSSSDTAKTAVEISESEGRILICSPVMFQQVQCLCPNAVLFTPVNKYGDHVPIASILHRFNVQFNTKNILSRCLVCNSKENVKLTLEDLNLLQEYVKNNDFTILNSENEDNFQKTLSDMIKSGINVKFKNEDKSYFTEKSQAILCKKCGTVQ